MPREVGDRRSFALFPFFPVSISELLRVLRKSCVRGLKALYLSFLILSPFIGTAVEELEVSLLGTLCCTWIEDANSTQ
jgi:hypothetical protein